MDFDEAYPSLGATGGGYSAGVGGGFSMGYGFGYLKGIKTSSHTLNISYNKKDKSIPDQTSGINSQFVIDYRYSYGIKSLKLVVGPEFAFFNKDNSSRMDVALLFGGEFTSHFIVHIVNICQQVAKLLKGDPPQYTHVDYVEFYMGYYIHQYIKDTSPQRLKRTDGFTSSLLMV